MCCRCPHPPAPQSRPPGKPGCCGKRKSSPSRDSTSPSQRSLGTWRPSTPRCRRRQRQERGRRRRLPTCRLPSAGAGGQPSCRGHRLCLCVCMCVHWLFSCCVRVLECFLDCAESPLVCALTVDGANCHQGPCLFVRVPTDVRAVHPVCSRPGLFCVCGWASVCVYARDEGGACQPARPLL